MVIPPWAAEAILGFLLLQFGAFVGWAVRSDRMRAVSDTKLEALTKLLMDNNLAVLADRVRQGDLEHARHVAGHERNRTRIEEIGHDAATVLADLAVLKSQTAANTAQIAASLAKLS